MCQSTPSGALTTGTLPTLSRLATTSGNVAVGGTLVSLWLSLPLARQYGLHVLLWQLQVVLGLLLVL